MNRFARVIMLAKILLFAATATASSQSTESITFNSKGVLSWSNEAPGHIQTVEWASALNEKWHSTWDALSDISPQTGHIEVDVPMFFRLRSLPVTTDLPEEAGILLCSADGIQTPYTNLIEAYVAAQPNDTIIMLPGEYSLTNFNISKSNITFFGTAPPLYDVAKSDFAEGVIWDARTRIGTTRGLSFVNIGFKDSSGGDPFMSGGYSTNIRSLYMYNCSFAGTLTNAHNIEVIGRDVRLDSCKSYNGGHNFAFKTYDLKLNNIYSYNGAYNGIILKGSSTVGDLDGADLNNITIEGPVDKNTARGLHIEGYSAGSSAKNVRINGLKTRNVNMAVYIWPHTGSIVRDITISDAESFNSYQVHGDYFLQPGVTNVVFIGCRSYDSTGPSFVLGSNSENIRLVDCFSSRPVGSQYVGPFDLKHINGLFQ